MFSLLKSLLVILNTLNALSVAVESGYGQNSGEDAATRQI